MKTLLNSKNLSLVENSLLEIETDLRKLAGQLRKETEHFTNGIKTYKGHRWYKRIFLQDPLRSNSLNDIETICQSIKNLEERKELFSALKKAIENGETVEVNMKKLNL
ncbi:hypothetical protein [Guptibacillus spartinae]|uniref:hypothetical protein n=1 Tax=Guptibacillus spartinae TaxID=3025679 RepID=UPI00235EC936|nr:hypothetical protein [Pseudalkalibacillus spartinae]